MIKSPLWKQPLVRSLHKTESKPESRYFQLATVDSDGVPQCRTVVFRGFTDNHHLQFLTDSRTPKWKELLHNNKVSVCWYFAATREQYRISGSSHLNQVSKQQLDLMWQNLSQKGKQQFLWGQPKQLRSANHSLDVDNENIPKQAPSYFEVVNIEVEKLDFLTLRGDPQTRTLYIPKNDGSWLSENVIP